MSKSKPDYDDPEIEERWCAEQRTRVTNYLRAQKVHHARIGEWPAWHVAPIASIWAIEDPARLERVGWWAISGDLPTDHIAASDIEPPQHPRKAMRKFAQNWFEVLNAWKSGRQIENTRIGDPASRQELGPMLQSRAKVLMEWADDDSLWEEG